MSRLVQLEPYDTHNQSLEENVHPPTWANPVPDGRYHLVVIGAGTAGLVAAAGAAGLGAKVALVERHLMGGDCLNVGCVPSKAIIRAARAAAAVRDASGFGVRVEEHSVDFAHVMERMRMLRAGISPHDSAERFQRLGVDVFLGNGRFLDSDTIDVEGTKLKFKRAVIATGARASAPPIAGLDEIDYLTNESLFSLTELPKRLAIIGAGPIGCEMAQSFARFGSEVLLVEATHGVLPREDRDAADVVERSLTKDGVRLLCCGRQLELSRDGSAVRLRLDSHDQSYDETVDRLLVSAGRAPNVEGLNLEGVGVQFDRKTGVQVNDHLQTTNRRIYSAGDICSPFKFTHAADFMARIVIQNSLFPFRAKASALTIPWCTYTCPELAHIGVTPEDETRIDTITQPLVDVDRAVLDGESEGFVRIHTKSGTDRIVGATIVASHAGDLIGEISLAMTHGIGLRKIASTIHPYPTQAEAIRKVGDTFNRGRLTPRVKSIMRSWLAWTR